VAEWIVLSSGEFMGSAIYQFRSWNCQQLYCWCLRGKWVWLWA